MYWSLECPTLHGTPKTSTILAPWRSKPLDPNSWASCSFDGSIIFQYSSQYGYFTNRDIG